MTPFERPLRCSVRQYATVGQTERPFGACECRRRGFRNRAALFSSSVRQRATAGQTERPFGSCECRRRGFRNRAAFCKAVFKQRPPASNSRAQKRPFRRANAAGAAFATQPPFGNDGASGQHFASARQPGAETAFSPCERRRRDVRSRAAFCKDAPGNTLRYATAGNAETARVCRSSAAGKISAEHAPCGAA